jgi:hypothetical protein
MTILDEFRGDAERVLDRLVDGELGPQDRGELLVGLDDEPGGWRRCALAFLEAQSWRWQLSRLSAEPILAQFNARPRNGAARRGLYWAGALGIAASLGVAFLLGTRFPAGGPFAGDLQLAAQQPGQDLSAQAAWTPMPPLADETNAPSARQPWQTLKLTPLGGNSQEPIELRVVESTSDDAQELAGRRSALSGQLLRGFEQEGFEVNRRERLVPIDLSDGRRVLVPIEEVDIRSPDVARL